MTSKSHKSRKTVGEPKPRQRKNTGTVPSLGQSGSSLVLSPSSEVPVTTVSSPPSNSFEEAKEKAKAKVDTGIPAEKPKEQQSWYRAPDSKLRPQSAKIAVMRAAGSPVADIAKRLKTSEANVRFIEYIARKNGWYDSDDEPVDLEVELALNIDRKVVRNIDASLDGQMTNWQTHEMTIAAAKGRGIFKSSDKQPEVQGMQVVAIQVVMPPVGIVDQQIVETNTGGTPAYVEGEVADVEPRLVGSADNKADPTALPDAASSISGSR